MYCNPVCLRFYTFYDPETPAKGFGTYAVLWQIAQCQQLALPYLYLGYWIRQSPKMAYKTRFRPMETLRAGNWQLLDETTDPAHTHQLVLDTRRQNESWAINFFDNTNR